MDLKRISLDLRSEIQTIISQANSFSLLNCEASDESSSPEFSFPFIQKNRIYISLLLVCRVLVCKKVTMSLVTSSKNPNLNVIVGANLRRFRNKLSVSQDEFADMAGLHRTYIGAVERGERNITLGTLQRIATALNLEPTDLLTKR